MRAVDTNREPYVGPRPYAEDERAIFFGRDAEIDELVSAVIAHRTVFVYAVSGAGKSSLLRAGMSPSLAEQGFEVLGPLRLQSPVAPPADAPNVFSYAALRALTLFADAGGPHLDPELDPSDFLAALPRGTDAYGFPSPRVVILDQFEEIFTAYQERWQHREGFLKHLAEALNSDPELRIVFSVREEYLAALERYAALLPDGLRARFHLERLRAPAALAAVTGPLRLKGVSYDPGVAETLVHDLRETRIDVGGGTTLRVEGEFVEPVQLQVVCRTLWARLDPTGRRVTADDLAALGSVDDSLTQYYTYAIAASVARTSVAEPKLREELERLLITSAGTRATVFAGDNQTTRQLAAALDELQSRHLIRAEWRAGGHWLELAHDRLIEPIRLSNELVRDRHRRRRLRRLAIGVGLLSIAVVALAIAASSLWVSRAMLVPPVDGTSSEAYAEKVEDLDLVPKVRKDFNEADKGTIFRVTPASGEEVEPGTTVTVFVSAGFPQLAFDNDRDVLLVNGADGSKLKPIAEGSQDELDPTWNADGNAVAYTSDGRVFLSELTKRNESPRALTEKGQKFSDLAWAPTANVNAIAMAKVVDGKSDLCLGRLGPEGMNVACKHEPDITIERTINWAPDGKSILAWGFRPDNLKFGMVRWTTKKPFSTDPGDWSAGTIETDTSKEGEGVLDAVISPHGQQMAVVRVDGDGRPELLLAKPDDFLLRSDPKPLGVRACKVTWRPDGRQLVVVRADDCFASATGELIRLPVDNPEVQLSLKTTGDNPAFQPLTAK